MQVNSTLYTVAATNVSRRGNNLLPNNTDKAAELQSSPSVRDLAQSIDPSNMSRNEARALANVLMQSDTPELSTSFVSYGMVQIRNGDGSRELASESDPLMNEKFNMFDSIHSHIEFLESKGLSIERELSALSFLEKIKMMEDLPQVNTYA